MSSAIIDMRADLLILKVGLMKLKGKGLDSRQMVWQLSLVVSAKLHYCCLAMMNAAFSK